MESIDFLKSKLEELYKALPYLEIRYEHRLSINTHIIEIHPIHCFEKDKDYIDFQIFLENEFENLFIEEEILFITSNELISIQNPIAEFGASIEECDYELIAPVKVGYSLTNFNFNHYHFETNMKTEFEIPDSPPISKSWWKISNKSNKTLTNNQGFFM
jgi:hypothetical protein